MLFVILPALIVIIFLLPNRLLDSLNENKLIANAMCNTMDNPSVTKFLFFSYFFFGFGVLPTFVLCKAIICVLCRHLNMTPEPIFVMQMLMFLRS